MCVDPFEIQTQEADEKKKNSYWTGFESDMNKITNKFTPRYQQILYVIFTTGKEQTSHNLHITTGNTQSLKPKSNRPLQYSVKYGNL